MILLEITSSTGLLLELLGFTPNIWFAYGGDGDGDLKAWTVETDDFRVVTVRKVGDACESEPGLGPAAEPEPGLGSGPQPEPGPGPQPEPEPERR
eukprot:COSAG04_NODE_27306_length_284_cov_1.113514_1_plen_94_part_11